MDTPKITALTKAIAHMQTFRLWTEQEREISLQKTLAEHNPTEAFWVFAYGSLIWRPEFSFEEHRKATLRGYSRALCLWSCINRGTPEQPGLVFGIQEGGQCQGKVYRLSNDNLEEQFRTLWKREMPSDSYIPTWVTCETASGPVNALAFIIDTNTHAYIGGLSDEEIIDIVVNANGTCGSCSDYVIQTTHALIQAEIKDDDLERISELVKQRLQLNRI